MPDTCSAGGEDYWVTYHLITMPPVWVRLHMMTDLGLDSSKTRGYDVTGGGVKDP